MPPAHSRAARDHHYVPRFLLRAWALGEVVHGWWWNPWKDQLVVKSRGVASFCNQIDLLTIGRHQLGQDVIERIFFGHVDTRGASVYQKIISSGVQSLTGEERSDFARLLLSLEFRKPEMVRLLRDQSKAWTQTLNNDPELLALMAEHGISKTPIEYWLEKGGGNLEDRAVMLIQGLVDNQKLGPILINSHWRTVTLKPGEESFVLADRPLMRFRGLGDPDCLWVLPLTPLMAFVAAPQAATIQAVLKPSARRFAISSNGDSARHAERFVFSVEERHARWLGRYLKDKPHVGIHNAKSTDGKSSVNG